MKKRVPLSLATNRVREGPMASDESYGLAGGFRLIGPKGVMLLVMSSGPASTENDTGWEHVSVTCQSRTPNWQEMAFVKDIFWSEEECVVQYHPPKSEYVNCHPFCLHLWKQASGAFPMPPSLLVGPRRPVRSARDH